MPARHDSLEDLPQVTPSRPSAPPHRVLPPEPSAFMLTLAGGPRGGQSIPVGRGRLVIGRRFGGLQLNERFVSEGHASFFQRGHQLCVEDGRAPSGVYVSAPRHVLIEPERVFCCGHQVFRFRGQLPPPREPLVYGFPPPVGAYRVEHVLVGNRPGRSVVFHHGLTIGRTDGALKFPDDTLLDVVHAELKPTPIGMELITHSRRLPNFLRMGGGSTVPLEHGAMVLIGDTMLRVVAVARA